jgi:hypothetical protein
MAVRNSQSVHYYGGLMGDLKSGSASQGQPGQVGNASPEGATEGAEPQQITLERVEALVDQRVKDALRQSQSMIDKADRRITDRLQPVFQSIDYVTAMLKEAGVEVKPEMIEQLKHKQMLKELGGESVEGEGSRRGSAQDQGQGRSQASDPSQSPVIATALAMMREAGVFIEDKDPEFKLIDLQSGSVSKILSGVQAAIKEKVARLSASGSAGESNQAQQTKIDQEGRAATIAARNPGTGIGAGKSVQGPPDGLKAMDYFKRGYSKSTEK